MCEVFCRFIAAASRLHITRSTSAVYGAVNVRHYYSSPVLDKNSFVNSDQLKCINSLCNQPTVLNTYSTFNSVSSVRTFSTAEEKCSQQLDYIDTNYKDVYEILAKDMIVQKDFLSEEEETSLLGEVERYIKRLRYEFDHWDNAIHGFREMEKKSWDDDNSKIIKRVQNLAFSPEVIPLPFVHVLDISKEGYIKPHVDAVRFCGDTIAGMCLLSSCVMRLALEKDSSKYGDVYLPRRCLYIMKNRARYEFTHEVLRDETSLFRNQRVPRDRRISVICRCEPNPGDIK